MTTAETIEVKFVDPPAPGKKLATIKTAAGEVYGVWPEQFGLFRPGQKYRIAYRERVFNNQTYRTITKCDPANNVRAKFVAPPAGSSDEREREFVARALAASIQACAVEYSQDGLINTARMLRAVYRETFG